MENKILILKNKDIYNKLNSNQKKLLVYQIMAELGKTDGNYNEILNMANINSIMPTLVYNTAKSESKNLNSNKELLEYYKIILENYKELANELKLNSSLELSQFLAILIRRGYISVNKQHQYNENNRLLMSGLYPLNIIKGGGVCLDYAELLNDYLDACNKKSAILPCKMQVKYNIKNIPGILLSPIENLIGNHTINIIEENNKLFAYDITNLRALNINSTSTARTVDNKYKYKIKPLVSFIVDPYSDNNNIFDKLFYEELTGALSNEEFILNTKKIKEVINSNKSLINDSYDNIHNYLELIDKQTDEINKTK